MLHRLSDQSYGLPKGPQVPQQVLPRGWHLIGPPLSIQSACVRFAGDPPLAQRVGQVTVSFRTLQGCD